jgi:RNA polymerase sigma-70 factor (ECF subfamily)
MHDWPQIHEQFGPLVWRTVYRILGDHAEALDCFQDVFAELLKRSSSRSVGAWPAFLRWIAVRRALDRLRKYRSHAERVAQNGDLTSLPASSAGPDAQARWNELIARVQGELVRLPVHQAEAFWMHCVEEMSREEIGQHLGVPTSTVGVLVHRARQRLRHALAELNPVAQTASRRKAES